MKSIIDKLFVSAFLRQFFISISFNLIFKLIMFHAKKYFRWIEQIKITLISANTNMVRFIST